MKGREKIPVRRSRERLSEGKDAAPARLMACIGPDRMYPDADVAKIDRIRSQAEAVNYHGRREDWASNNQRNGGMEESYVVSAINERDKFSDKYHNCTGVVVVGADKKTGKNISLLTHEDPHFIHRSPELWRQFLSDIRDAFTEIRERCAEDSVEVALFAGDFNDNSPSIVDQRAEAGKTRTDDYVEAVEAISIISKEVLDIDPRVVAGPKRLSWDSVSAVLDTENRRLYLFRPSQMHNGTDKDFPASAVREALDSSGE